VERTIYRLSPNGDFKAIRVPLDPKMGCYVYKFGVVQKGILIQTGGGHVRDLNLSRLYLLHDKGLSEVIRGVISTRRVSPDGCRLAIGISSNNDSRKPRAPFYTGHLKVIDFCEKGK
jgi:hypothetical protein